MNKEDLEMMNKTLLSENRRLIILSNKRENTIKHIEDYIEHELNYHILKNDEETWNNEFYTNGKLDYRKLLIGLLNEILLIIEENDHD